MIISSIRRLSNDRSIPVQNKEKNHKKDNRVCVWFSTGRQEGRLERDEHDPKSGLETAPGCSRFDCMRFFSFVLVLGAQSGLALISVLSTGGVISKACIR